MCVFSLFVSITLTWCPGSFQIKDILKGALRFNQSQLEAEENEEISIADDHYTSTAVAETALSANSHQGDHQQEGSSRRIRDSDMDGSVSTDEKEEEEEQAMTPPEQQVNCPSVLFRLLELELCTCIGINYNTHLWWDYFSVVWFYGLTFWSSVQCL